MTTRAFWLMFAKTLGFALSFALPLLLVRRLSQAEFGLYKQVFLVVGTALALLPLGFGMSAFYFLPRRPEHHRQVVFNILLFNAAVGGAACLTLALFPTVLVSVFNTPEMVEYAPLIGVLILLWVVSSFLDIAPVARQETGVSTVFIIAAQLTRTLLLLAAAVGVGTVRALVWAAIVQGTLQTALLLFYLRARFPGYWRCFDWAVMRTQLAYALPLGFAGLLYTMQLDLHNYFVSNRFGPAAFAVYSIGCFQLPLLGILSDSVTSVMTPRVSHLQDRDDRREIINITARVMRKLALIFFPVYAFLIVCGREFISFLFTPRYLESWPVFAVNLTLLPLGVLLLDPIQRSFPEHRYFLLRLRAALFVVLLAVLWAGTEYLGLVGTISVVVVLSIVERIAILLNVGKIVGVRRHDWRLLDGVWRVGAAALAAGLVTAAARSSAAGLSPLAILSAGGLVFALTYSLAILLFGGLTPEEHGSLRRGLSLLRRWRPWRREAESTF